MSIDEDVELTGHGEIPTRPDRHLAVDEQVRGADPRFRLLGNQPLDLPNPASRDDGLRGAASKRDGLSQITPDLPYSDRREKADNHNRNPDVFHNSSSQVSSTDGVTDRVPAIVA